MPPLSLPEAGRRHDRAHRAGAARLHRTAADRRRTRRAPLAGGGGTLNEYYDFSLYGYLAVVIAPLFFPSDDPVTSLLAALVVFGTACLIRPLGGIVLGHTGDKYGRKRALLATLICMGVGSTLMGVLPNHAQVGVWATVPLVAVRSCRASRRAVRSAARPPSSPSPPRGTSRRPTGPSPPGCDRGVRPGSRGAGITTGLTTDAQMDSWGWRIPFLLALPLTPFCLWARTRVEETHGAEEAHKQHSPVGDVFRKQPKALLQASAISAATNGTAYIGLTYLGIHLIQQLGYDAAPVHWVATAAIGISALCMPLGGLLGDRIGRVRLAEIGFVGYILLTYPMMALIDNGLGIASWPTCSS